MQQDIMPIMTQSGAAATVLDLLSVDTCTAVRRMNSLASSGLPFLFLVDAWAGRWVVEEIPTAISGGLLWNIDGLGPLGRALPPPRDFTFTSYPLSRENYRKGFEILRRGQIVGDTYLANLTYPTPLETNLSLESLARSSRAPFRLWVPGAFTVFSPERFVSIDENGCIASFPMKGTIDASFPDAAKRILSDSKEAAEHVTIVDLIRNDLGSIAEKVHVPRYRFLSEVSGLNRRLLQVSSEVRGELGRDWQSHIGDSMRQILPAGSVTGAPKKRTCELIREAEGYDRGWYTGVFGVFDGRSLDSAVMIRFIERDAGGGLVYKSGGGITIYSEMDAEYAELEAKIYAPFA